ncbi:enoyl-[acyl-carrier-protein] reductase [Psittacicella melopsittaci]|uniref:Enoyl-[acyl-carrier-protein] reductase [NADH] n=1 Tax=Psittacicella melopsittaci TaxID=2028576 RepID=A0A3A1Y831_9GAMM|nr:enoyl-ACP reductase [Psittacicella melopsittaci]RIY32277.1 enoyl-[acyl-carrier-protein] reductase [Psittacicella melopsittaci]
MGILKNKKILVTGIASNLSIAYGIAQELKEQGAELAFTYFGDKLKGRVEKFAAEFGSDIVLELNASDDESIAKCFEDLAKVWPTFDGFVHSIAFAGAEQLDGNYVDAVTREGFRIAHDTSSYSLAAMTKAAVPYLNEGASIVTLTYLGAERAIPNYNVMGLAKASLEANVRYIANALGYKGIRCNAISAGPIKTLAAKGIKNFSRMLDYFEHSAPLRRTVTTREVGGTAAYLLSNLASGVTGEVIHVDGGFSIAAMNETFLEN